MGGPSERESKRAAILFAVLAVVAREGLGAVSIRSVAAEAGVSVGAVQHYFASKQELVRAAVTSVIDGAETGYTAGAPRSPQDELWELLAHGLPHASRAPAATSVFYSFVAAGTADPWIAATLADAKSGVESLVADLLGVLHPELPDGRARARRLLALSDGLTLQVLIGHLSADEARACLRGALAAELPAPS